MSSFLLTSLIAEESTEEVFSNIYRKKLWGQNDQGEGFSGLGSLVVNAIDYMEFLQNFIKEKEIKTIVDIGCGDWTFSKYLDWNGSRYIGIDVVKDVIVKNHQQFSSPMVTFVHGDILNMQWPDGDLLICKDVLQHLTNEDVFTFLEKIGKYKHCLITNDVDPNTLTSTNPDIERGRGRFIDLAAPPFNIKGRRVLSYNCIGWKKVVFHIENSPE